MVSRAKTTMRTRAGDRDDMMEDTDSSTNPTGETIATNHRRDAETRSFGNSDDALDDRARDATAETLVDIMKLTRGGTSPNAARARERERDDDDDNNNNSARYCSSCKQHLPNERFLGVHRKTCAACLRWHKLYQRRKRRSRKKRD
jgi:hypothetical protein